MAGQLGLDGILEQSVEIAFGQYREGGIIAGQLMGEVDVSHHIYRVSVAGHVRMGFHGTLVGEQDTAEDDRHLMHEDTVGIHHRIVGFVADVDDEVHLFLLSRLPQDAFALSDFLVVAVVLGLEVRDGELCGYAVGTEVAADGFFDFFVAMHLRVVGKDHQDMLLLMGSADTPPACRNGGKRKADEQEKKRLSWLFHIQIRRSSFQFVCKYSDFFRYTSNYPPFLYFSVIY